MFAKLLTLAVALGFAKSQDFPSDEEQPLQCWQDEGFNPECCIKDDQDCGGEGCSAVFDSCNQAYWCQQGPREACKDYDISLSAGVWGPHEETVKFYIENDLNQRIYEVQLEDAIGDAFSGSDFDFAAMMDSANSTDMWDPEMMGDMNMSDHMWNDTEMWGDMNMSDHMWNDTEMWGDMDMSDHMWNDTEMHGDKNMSDAMGDYFKDYMSDYNMSDYDDMNKSDHMWNDTEMWGDMNMSDHMWNDTEMHGDWNMSDYDYDMHGDMHMNDSMWNDTDMMDMNMDMDMGMGAPQQCEYSDCEIGSWCLISRCMDPMSGNQTCTQDYMDDDYEMHTYDCAEGLAAAEDVCEMVCDYNDCFEEKGTTCWEEICDDGCGNGNCTLWLQNDGEWYGEDCDQGMDFRAQDAVVGMAETGRQYEDTIDAVQAVACMGDPACMAQIDTVQGLFNYELPPAGAMPMDMDPTAAAGAVPGGQDMAMQAGQAAEMAPMAAQQQMAMASPYVDAFLGNPMLKDIASAFMQDTVEAQGGEDASLGVANAVLSANSTEEVMGMAAQIPPDQVLQEMAPEENTLMGSVWGVFTEGLMNSGMFRMGGRR